MKIKTKKWLFPPVRIEPGPCDSKSNMVLGTHLENLETSVHAPLDSWTKVFNLESIEHDYVRILKCQSYKPMPS